jgi:uncharacterized transporter YbjL
MVRERPAPDVVGLASGAVVGTAVMTAVMETAQARGMTRMSLPYLLGTMVARRRASVRISGIALHFVNGALFASGYALVFTRARRADWRIGAALGLLHGAVVLVAGLPVIQEIHPRMAEEDEGPDPTPMLQPPGFMALNYGVRTPVVTLAAHAVYGAIVGSFYRV